MKYNVNALSESGGGRGEGKGLMCFTLNKIKKMFGISCFMKESNKVSSVAKIIKCELPPFSIQKKVLQN